MDKLFKDMQSKGLVSGFKLIRKAKVVFDYIKVMATTEPMETDKDWWQLYLSTKSWN